MSFSGESSSAAMSGGGGGEIVLFGVRVKVDPMRKCVSLNNLSEYEGVSDASNLSGTELPKAVAEGGGSAEYASADDAVPLPSTGTGERKRGVPWTEEEHKLFLIGLQKVGKGDWRGISRNYVKTRTPTQVASHAQKYFLRRSNLNRRRRRSSLFDITTDSIPAIPMEEGLNHHDIPAQPASVPLPASSNMNVFSVVPFPVTFAPVPLTMQGVIPMETSVPDQSVQVNNSSPMLVHQVPICPSSTMADLNLYKEVPSDPSPLSLRLSLATGHDQSSTRDFSIEMSSSFKNGDSGLSVA
ncbi:hypothetical protein ACS0TY_006960 [Phlomoides rotata]